MLAWFLAPMMIGSIAGDRTLESILPRPRPSEPDVISVDVVIIGAGAAGVSAAHHLVQSGVTDLVILEAEAYVGGRVRDHNLAGTVVELGANWVHGYGMNPILSLVKKYKIEGRDEDPASFLVRSSTGEDVTRAVNERRRLFRDLRLHVPGLARRRRADGLPDISVRTAMHILGWQSNNSIDRLVEWSEVDFWDAVMADHLSIGTHFSYGHLIAPSSPDEQFFITDQRGYNRMLDSLLREAVPHGDDRLFLGEKVVALEQDALSVLVSTDTGKRFLARFVLSTVSVAVYQRKLLHFSPPLPETWMNALKKIYMGLYVKVFVKFPYQFWDNKEYVFVASDRVGYYSCFQSLDAGGRHNPPTNTLLVTLTGVEGQRVEDQPDHVTQAEIMSVLKGLYGNDIPEPVDIVVPRWSKNPHFGGTFPEWMVGLEHGDFLALQQNHGRIFFAGDGFSESYLGFLYGAYFSAFDRAVDIVTALKGYLRFSPPNMDAVDSCVRHSDNECPGSITL